MRSRQRTETLWISKPVIFIFPGSAAAIGMAARPLRSERLSTVRNHISQRGGAEKRLSCTGLSLEGDAVGHLYANILETVGNTPVVRINKLGPPGVNLYVKIEAFNPLGS